MKNIVHIYGGLGNQMFQFAFYTYLLKQNPDTYINTGYFSNRRVKAEHDSKYLLALVFPKIEVNPVDDWKSKTMYSDAFLWMLLRRARKLLYRKNEIIKTFRLIEHYDPEVPPTKAAVNHYRAYWQEYRFVQKVEPELRYFFEFDLNKAGSRNLDCIKKMNDCNSVSIHVRRGDYLRHREIYGNICTRLYYSEAIRIINGQVDDPHFFVFSDDIEWCRQEFKSLSKVNFVDWNVLHAYFDMRLMAQCKHNIIANSSFSWWAAWLNENEGKIIIMPKKWNKYITSDILAIHNWIQC